MPIWVLEPLNLCVVTPIEEKIFHVDVVTRQRCLAGDVFVNVCVSASVYLWKNRQNRPDGEGIHAGLLSIRKRNTKSKLPSLICIDILQVN